MFKVNIRLIAIIFSLLVGNERAVQRLCVLYPGICLTTEGRSPEKTSVRVVVEKYEVGTNKCEDMATFWG